MSGTSPSSRIREAAETLRARAAAATPGPWSTGEEIDGYRAGRRTIVTAPTPGYAGGVIQRRVVSVGQTRRHHDGDGVAEANVAYVATMDPSVGLLLADLLDACAATVAECAGDDLDPAGTAAALALADSILPPEEGEGT